MANYITAFNNVADKASTTLNGLPIKTWVHVDPEASDRSEEAKNFALAAVQLMAAEPHDLIGKCFANVSLVSSKLLREQIKHTVTIGDVFVNGTSYFGATHASLLADMEMGSSVESPAAAHAWITLENGVVIDVTLNASLANKGNKPAVDWAQAIYVSTEPYEHVEHVPMLLGTEYQLRAIVVDNEFAKQYFIAHSRLVADLLTDV
jgi:hypothetical protein